MTSDVMCLAYFGTGVLLAAGVFWWSLGRMATEDLLMLTVVVLTAWPVVLAVATCVRVGGYVDRLNTRRREAIGARDAAMHETELWLKGDV